MVRKKSWLDRVGGMVAVAVLVGMTVVGCGTDDEASDEKQGGATDKPTTALPAGLVGTWYEIFNDMSMELYDNSTFLFVEEGEKIGKGNFTISGSRFTWTNTHISGAVFIHKGLSDFDPSMWYDKKGVASAVPNFPANDLDELFKTHYGTYNGNILSFNAPTHEGNLLTFTKSPETTPGTGQPASLIGSWVNDSGYVLILEPERFEMRAPSKKGAVKMIEGPYLTRASDSTLGLSPIRIHGDFLNTNPVFEPLMSAFKISCESKWYEPDELKTFFRYALGDYYQLTGFDVLIDALFASKDYKYVLSMYGNYLLLMEQDNPDVLYTRKP